ncbi:hypothetical protein BDF20DRAFT_917378 [Mycotypha africana]|uniref:uncharacterized protein n=1 Tax=Mycotypha africana TaxID=64632 RepID=UPI0022FFD11B|nr:uncharacterized protein BDF20DRAFT_917378 [Mycotypha africana]KAI8967775.1 hypothetical protein BDF20DRAFT_917378 [Mycotypha africana]
MNDDSADYNVADYKDLTENWHCDPTAYLHRYYSLYFKKANASSDAVNVYVRQAPSKVCVLGMSEPPEGIRALKLHTELIGEKVKPDTILCDLMDKDGKLIGHVRAEMEGKLLELNTRLTLTEEQQEEDMIDSLLYKEKHHMVIGFIGIILPRFEDTAKQLREFVEETKNN